MKLSENLTMAEVVKSSTAKRLYIDNTKMTDDVLENLKAIATKVFQPCRDELGPIIVTSGYRSPELNKAIGGATNSQHSKGEALDIEGMKASNHALFNFIKDNIEFDQLIWEFGDEKEPDWVHVSYKRNGNNRNMILVAKKNNGKTVYSSWEG